MKNKILDYIEYMLVKIYFRINKKRRLAFINDDVLTERVMAEFHF
ncbi:MAG: hypothetical protein PHW73_01205 [Atribacterota bacterium]|nr:hypothetical protein [Atribacterota bacterium]